MRRPNRRNGNTLTTHLPSNSKRGKFALAAALVLTTGALNEVASLPSKPDPTPQEIVVKNRAKRVESFAQYLALEVETKEDLAPFHAYGKNSHAFRMIGSRGSPFSTEYSGGDDTHRDPSKLTGVDILDLGSDFADEPDTYEVWIGREHGGWTAYAEHDSEFEGKVIDKVLYNTVLTKPRGDYSPLTDSGFEAFKRVAIYMVDHLDEGEHLKEIPPLHPHHSSK